MNTLISVIVPFYKGNQYLPELVKNLEDVDKAVKGAGYHLELIIVNDSPEIDINLPSTHIPHRIITNAKNSGIHFSRAAGLKAAEGEWVIFMDQDDLLIADNYNSMMQECGDGTDVIVGNGYYYRSGEKQLNYKNRAVMDYLIRGQMFIGIRNLIPSPGEVLIRKSTVPRAWQENIVQHSGADDWMLWLMLFDKQAVFTTVPETVYIHRSTDHGNLSFDLKKMWVSAHEMVEILQKSSSYSSHDLNTLSRAIDFKYYKDTGKIKPYQWFYYIDRVLANVVYKTKVALL